MNEERKPARQGRSALYARVSTDRQSQGGTIDSQVSLLRQRIEADGGTLEEELCFIDDGISGTTLIRPALERLRDQAAAGAIDRLYMLSPDRLARRHAHQMVLLEELQACNVEVVFINRPSGTTPEDQLLLQVQSVVAEYERAKILERTRRGRLHAARCGRVSVLGHAPFGYRYIDRHSGGGVARYEIVANEAEVVRQSFTWVGREGCSVREVCRRLEKHGIRTRRGHHRWNPATIAAMLRNSAYRGQAAWGKTRLGARRPRPHSQRGQPDVPKLTTSVYTQPASEHILIPVPALVPDDLFAIVQERMQENRRRLRQGQRGPRCLLQGFLVCSYCGYALAGSRSGHKRYYRCCANYNRGWQGPERCPAPTRRIDELDAIVWNDVCALLSEPGRLQCEFQRRQQTPTETGFLAAQKRVQTASVKVKQAITRMIDAYAAGLLEQKEFEPHIRALKERLARLDSEARQLAEQTNRDDELRLVCRHLERFADQIKVGLATANAKQRRKILENLVKRVEIGHDTTRIVYKVTARPFANAPTGGIAQDCLWHFGKKFQLRRWCILAAR